MAIWVMENSREGQKNKKKRFCPKLDHISRKHSCLEKWIRMANVFLPKFDPFQK